MVVDPLGDVLAEAGDGDEVIRAVLDRDGARRGPADQPLAGEPASVTFSVVSSPVPRRRAAREAVAAAEARRSRHRRAAAHAGCRSSLWALDRARRARPPSGAAHGRATAPTSSSAVRRGRRSRSAYTWALAARTGGRPVIFGGAGAASLGVAVILLDEDLLHHRRGGDDLRRERRVRGDGDGPGGALLAGRPRGGDRRAGRRCRRASRRSASSR